MKKLNPLNFCEHIALANDMRKAQEILEPWLEKLYQAYGVESKESKEMHKVLNLLSSKMCCELDNRWYSIPKFTRDELESLSLKSPYYGSGKTAYI